MNLSASFIHENFLLDSVEAIELYHRYAKEEPIIDYHCHLLPQELAENKRWNNITQIWLYGDHYKWRAMRAAGVSEEFCTGKASDEEKFLKYAEIAPLLLRNPLYHWSHLELKNYFGIADRLLSSKAAGSIWNDCNQVVQGADFSAWTILKKSKVQVVCTTDDPTDSLEFHHKIQVENKCSAKVFPTWRPDKVLSIDRLADFNSWIDRLGEVSQVAIHDLDSLLMALKNRHDFFAQHGCTISDRGIETVWAVISDRSEVNQIFKKALKKESLSPLEIIHYKSFLLHELAVMDAEKDWTMQIHFGSIRNNNSKMHAQLGPDTGFDAIGDFSIAQALVEHFDRLNSESRLPRTILYNLNPKDFEVIATIMGCFQEGPHVGKIQLGSGWWFLDQLDGMRRQIETISQFGLLSCFVGMLTDSRSFLSYTRHEYFRRLLCQILGKEMKKGLLPRDYELIGSMVRKIAYQNAKNYFKFNS